MHEAHHKAFSIAKITKLDLLNDIQNSLIKAYEKGLGFDEWKESIKPTLIKKGWWGESIVMDPKTKRIKKIYVGHRRLKTIFDTNMRVAYAQSRYNSQMKSEGEYFRYSAILDKKTRPTHAKLHGVILPKSDPFWNINYPPNGWHCRCKVQVLTKEEINSHGYKPLENSHNLPNIADPHWAYNVGDTRNIYINILKDKLNKNFNFFKNKKAYIKSIYDKVELDIKNIAQRLAIFKAIKELFTTTKKQKVEVAKTDIFGKLKPLYLSSDTVLSHKDKHPEITAFEYSLIPRMLEGEKLVFKDGDRHLIIIKKLGIYYRLVIKNIKNEDEIFIVSLAGLSNDKKNITRIIDHYAKKYKVKE